MVQLTHEEMIDYLRCPMYCKFKHRLKLKRPTSEHEAYRTTIHEVVTSFYYSILNEQPISKEALFSRWHKAWFPEETDPKKIMTRTLDVVKKKNYRDQVYKFLNTIYDEQAKLKSVPILVDSSATINVDGILFTSSFDVVREIKYGKKPIIEIMRIYSQSQNIPAFYDIRFDLKAIFQAVAFRELFETREDQILMRNTDFKDAIITISDKEINRFKNIVINVAEVIHEERFYPAVSLSCKSCVYRDVCDEYRF